MTEPVAPTGPLRHDRTVGRLRFAVTGAVDLATGSPGVDVARSRVASALGVGVRQLRLPRQVHSDRVVAGDEPWDGSPPDADAVLVTRPGVVAGVLAADCMPLLLGDPDRAVAAAVHVGRAGLHAGIVGAAVAALRAAGAGRVLALVGPTVCGRCYEVPAGMRDAVAADVPAAAGTTRQGTPSLDIPAGVRSQLHAAAADHGLGVEVDETWATCTLEDPASYSHRRDAPTGRHAALVTVLP